MAWRALELPVTVFVASPLLRAIDNPLAKAVNLAQSRRRAVPAFLFTTLALIVAAFVFISALAFGEVQFGGGASGGLAALSVAASAQFLEIRGWSAALLQRPYFLGTTALGGLAYFLLRAQQLGSNIALGRVTWPGQVAAAGASTFGGLILGNGGTGKTTLIDYLYQDYLRAQLRLFRQGDLAQLGGAELVDKYYRSKVGVGGAIAPYRVTGAATAFAVGYRRELVDTPGQAWRFKWRDPRRGAEACASSWSERIADAMACDHAMFINVMTYGYGAAVRRTEVFAAFGGRPDAPSNFDAEKYLRVTRTAEAEALGHAVDEIRRCVAGGRRPRKLTFVNLVNMAGFWWRDRDKVERYYADELRDLWSRLEAVRGLKIERFVPVSLLFDDMTTDYAKGAAEKCRTPVFCVDPDARGDVIEATVRAIGSLERALYGQEFRLAGAARGEE
jgi:hypothetical protein